MTNCQVVEFTGLGFLSFFVKKGWVGLIDVKRKSPFFLFLNGNQKAKLQNV